MGSDTPGKPQISANEPEHDGSRRDPEERPVEDRTEARDRNMDKTLADSFPTSDPPSSIPDPEGDDSLPGTAEVLLEDELDSLADGTWVAMSVGDRRLVGMGNTREEAIAEARDAGHTELSVMCVHPPEDVDIDLSLAS